MDRTTWKDKISLISEEALKLLRGEMSFRQLENRYHQEHLNYNVAEYRTAVLTLIDRKMVYITSSGKLSRA